MRNTIIAALALLPLTAGATGGSVPACPASAIAGPWHFDITFPRDPDALWTGLSAHVVFDKQGNAGGPTAACNDLATCTWAMRRTEEAPRNPLEISIFPDVVSEVVGAADGSCRWNLLVTFPETDDLPLVQYYLTGILNKDADLLGTCELDLIQPTELARVGDCEAIRHRRLTWEARTR